MSRRPAPTRRTPRCNSRARGGAAAVEAVEAIDIRLSIREGEMALEGHYRANREGCMRIDVLAGGARVFTEALNAEGGWNMAQSPASPQPNSERGIAALRHGVESPLRLFGLHEFPGRGHQLAAVGQETIGGEAFLRLDATYADGYRAEMYLDPRTHLMARMRERRPVHVDIDPNAKRIETRYSDYRAVNGVLYPFRSEEIDLDTGATLSVAEIASLAVNTAEARDVCASRPPQA